MEKAGGFSALRLPRKVRPGGTYNLRYDPTTHRGIVRRSLSGEGHLTVVVWRCGRTRSTAVPRAPRHKPNRKQRRDAEPRSLITERARAKPASHALLTSFGLSGTRRSRAGRRLVCQGELSREGDRTRQLIVEGITVAKGQTRRIRGGVETQRDASAPSVPA